MLKDPTDIDRFVRDASPGTWATYGRGEHPPRELVDAMRPYVDAGALIPTSKREAAGMLYLVKRGRGALDRAQAKRVVVARKGNWRNRSKTDLARVFECLVRAAWRGAVCPTHIEIGSRCGLTRDAARERVRELVRRGRIASAHDPHTGWRVITILAGPHAGKSTMSNPGPAPVNVSASSEGESA